MAGLLETLGVKEPGGAGTSPLGSPMPSTGTSGGGSGAQAGLDQVNQGAGTIGQALGQIGSALGTSGGSATGGPYIFKKGGSVKKYTKGGKINLDACGVSTHTKSKSSPNW